MDKKKENNIWINENSKVVIYFFMFLLCFALSCIYLLFAGLSNIFI